MGEPFCIPRASLIAQLIKNRLQCRRPWFNPWVGKIRWKRDRLPTPVFSGFPCGSAGKESACNVGDLGSIPGLGRRSGEGKGYPVQYSGLKNSMDCIVHGVAKNQKQLSDFHFSLVVQWIRPCALNVGGPGSIPGQGTRSHMPQLRPGAA